MKLAIHSVENKGSIDNECIWIDVLDDIPELGHYAILDTTYLPSGKISNEHRHMYWFPRGAVKRGDWIRLNTGKGENIVGTNDRQTKTHVFYWDLGCTVWNKEGDAAVLCEFADWNTYRI